MFGQYTGQYHVAIQHKSDAMNAKRIVRAQSTRSFRDKFDQAVLSNQFNAAHADLHRGVQGRLRKPHVGTVSVHGSPLQGQSTAPPSYRDSSHPTPRQRAGSFREKVNMPTLKSRPSLTSLHLPSFLQSSIPTPPPPRVPSRARSQSAAGYPQDYFSLDESTTSTYDVGAFLLDDDPFAAPAMKTPIPTPSLPPISPPEPEPLRPIIHSHSSPLLPGEMEASISIPLDDYSRYPIPRPLPRENPTTRPKSSGNGVRSASARPAFAPRPSLPSLYTLAQSNIVGPRKVRKGTVGARLPHEPWNLFPRSDVVSQASSTFETQEAREEFQEEPFHITPPNNGIDSYSALSAEPDVILPPSQSQNYNNNEHSYTRPLSSEELQEEGDHLYDLDNSPDFTPSPSYSTSGPSSTTLSRSSIVSALSSWSATVEQNNLALNHKPLPDTMPANLEAEDYHSDASDPLGYHSVFDYYTQDYTSSEPVSADHNHAERSLSPEVGLTPYTSMYSPEKLDSEHPGVDHARRGRGSSTGGYRSNQYSHVTSAAEADAVPADGANTRNTHDDPRGRLDGQREGEGFDVRKSSRLGGLNGRGDDERNGEVKVKERRPVTRPSSSNSSEYSSSSDEEAGNTEYYSVMGSIRGQSTFSLNAGGNGSDDDKPLAQSIPTALTAQRTIRKQVKHERAQRRWLRALKLKAKASEDVPPMPALPVTAPLIPVHPQSSSQEAALQASRSLRRERTCAKPSAMEPFAADDLARKLQSLQTLHTPPTTAPLPYRDGSSSRMSASRDVSARAKSPISRTPDQFAFLQQQPHQPVVESTLERSLRPMRSFHRPGPRRSDAGSPEYDVSPSHAIGRSATLATKRTADDSMVRRSSEMNMRGRPSIDKAARLPRSPDDSRRPSISSGLTSTRNSYENDSEKRPPVPPLPPAEVLSALAQQAKVQATQQRIFIGNKQRFCIVELLPNTTAGDVLGLVASQGALEGGTNWMLWELAQDFGMERPIRSFEILSDISATWNKDKMVNAFAVRSTPLAPVLSRNAIPSSSPTFRGWVDWESKRGKWNKRWLELREHSLWLSKRDTGKDETFLCSLSNFDAYYVLQRHKAPKPFNFAIKSTDKLTLFEDASDYLHVFSCNTKDGEKWMQVILVARSYVLYQERNILFSKGTGPTTTNAKPAALSRSGTRKYSTAASRPTQPLVNVTTPSIASAAASLFFEPGSLLAKRKGP